MRYQRRTTFVLAAVLAGLAASAGAQVIGKTMTVANMPACNSDKNFGLVIDAENATTLGAGGGSAAVWVRCISGTWTIDEVAAVADLSAYAELAPAADLVFEPTTDFGVTAGGLVSISAGAGPVSIIAVGATNDVSLLAADDVILTPSDALTVAPGGAATVTTTAGAITLTAGGTTEDASVISTDDIFLTPDDALVAVAGGAVTLTATAGTMALASSAGAITVTAVGATNDVTLTAADDLILAATDDTTVAGDAVSVSSTSISLNPGASTVELAMVAGTSTFLGSLILPIASAPPAACAAGTKGTIYYDSDINKLCVCNATAYVLVDDATTTTGCS